MTNHPESPVNAGKELDGIGVSGIDVVRFPTFRECLPLLESVCSAGSGHAPLLRLMRPSGDRSRPEPQWLVAMLQGRPCGVVTWTVDANNVAECCGPLCPGLGRNMVRDCGELLLQALTSELRSLGVGLARTHPAGPEVELALLQRLAVLPWQSPHQGRTERTIRYWRPCLDPLPEAWCHPVLEHFMEHFLEQTGWRCDLNMVVPGSREDAAEPDDLRDWPNPADSAVGWGCIAEQEIGRVTVLSGLSGEPGTGMREAVRSGLDANLPNVFVRLPLDCAAHANRLPWLVGLGFQPRYLEPGQVVSCILQYEDLLF